MKLTLYAKDAHGGIPIRVVGDNPEFGPYEIVTPSGSRIFHKPQELLRHLTGYNFWTMQRYFRLDTKTEVDPKSSSLFLLPRSEKGIDLSKRADEIRKLVYAGFGSRIMSSGFDVEDVLQEVYRGLLARNEGICPFDPTKSSFGHYVHMVTGCILNNYHRKVTRDREFEQLGVHGVDGAITDVRDVDLASPKTSDENHVEEEAAFKRLVTFIQSKGEEDVLQILPYLRDGSSAIETAKALNMDARRVRTLVRKAKDLTAEWYAE